MIWLDKVTGTTPTSHICKGELWTQYTDPIEGKNVIIYTWNKRQNMRTKYHSKNDTKCIIYTHRRSDRPIWSMQILCTDSLGNTHPLKVDRNLQWMLDHPTNPTYNPVLSGTMTLSSAWCLNSTTWTHNTNTYTQKVCIRYLTYCMPPLW